MKARTEQRRGKEENEGKKKGEEFRVIPVPRKKKFKKRLLSVYLVGGAHIATHA